MFSCRRPASLRRWLDLWAQYQDFRRPNVSPSTYQRDYRKIYDRLKAFKATAPHLGEAVDVLERDQIIAKFETDYPSLTPWVKFQFFTGARLQESVALTWANVGPDCSWIMFNKSKPIDTGIIQRTKSYRETKFPCNPRMVALLQSLCPSDRANWVHLGPRGGNFDYKNFQERYWKPLVNQLVDQGVLTCYLSHYPHPPRNQPRPPAWRHPRPCHRSGPAPPPAGTSCYPWPLTTSPPKMFPTWPGFP